MRAFVGIPVPEPWITPLMRAQGRLPGGREVDADDLHVTLAFLDEQPEARLEALAEHLDGRRLGGGTLAPLAWALLGERRPRAAVLDLRPDPALASLRDAVRAGARAAGMNLPRERFRPHVTLKRFSSRKPPSPRLLPALAELGPPGMPPVPAGSVTLWASTLTPDGPLYEPLAAWPCRSAA